MGSRLRVGVVGAGTAGSATAAFLGRAGHAVELFEAVAAPRAVGAGITLQPTGLAVLEALGLAARVAAKGAPIDRLVCVTPSGRPVVELAYRDVDPSWAGLGIHRGVLFEALYDAARDVARVRAGETVVGLEAAGAGRHRLRLLGGASAGPFDLVVVADGARSRLRAHTGLVRRATPYPYGALWFIADADGDPAGATSATTLRQTVRGTGEMVGLLPTGRGPDGRGPLVSLFVSVRADDVPEIRAAGLDAWKARVRATCPAAEHALAQIHRFDDVLFAGYQDVVLHAFATRGVVVLGDAAHATSPQLGQGSNLALVDAHVLARCVAAARDVPEALSAYDRARRDHLAYYQFATRWLTPLFQSDLAPLGPLRDALFPVATRLRFVRDLMTASMAGVVTSPFGARLPPPWPVTSEAAPQAKAEGEAPAT